MNQTPSNSSDNTPLISSIDGQPRRVSITRKGVLKQAAAKDLLDVSDLNLSTSDELLMRVFYLRNAFSHDMRTLSSYSLRKKIDNKITDLTRVMKKDLSPDTHLATILHGMEESRKELVGNLYLEPLLKTYIKKSIIRVIPRLAMLQSDDWPTSGIVTTIISRNLAPTVMFISHKWFTSGFDEDRKLFSSVKIALASNECKWVWIDKFCADQADPASDLIIVSKLLPHMIQYTFDAGSPDSYRTSAWCALEHLSFGLYPEDRASQTNLTLSDLKNPAKPPLNDKFEIFDQKDWVKIYLAYLSLGDSNMITGLTHAASMSESAFVRGTAWGLTISGDLQPRPNPTDMYSTVSCEKGHALKSGVVPSGVYTCDGCKKRIIDQRPVGMCRICNFDLCAECVYGS